MPFTEPKLPPIPADQREPVLILYREGEALAGAYTTALTWYAHMAAEGHREPGTEVRRSPIDPDEFLVLLPRPVTGFCPTTGKTCTFAAAILRKFEDGTVDGWLVRTHELAIATFETPPDTSDLE